ncbi:MAG: regulator of RNase E activity RraA [Granulosicoccus sp.]|jgi:regulator of RNase E activity RraA
MKTPELPDSLLALLKSVDTPTVCNAIEVAQKKRGFSAFTRSTMLASAQELPAMVGYAQTAKIAALHPPTESPDVIKARRLAYFEHMTQGRDPRIAVIEDVDYPECIGAWWGGVHTAVHKGLGLVGALTNGVMRDLDDMAEGFPVIAGSIGPSHGFVHVRELGGDVEIFGLKVKQGDLVHADKHGALVIPLEVLPKLEASIEVLFASEQIILEPASQPGFNLEKLKAAWREFESSRT